MVHNDALYGLFAPDVENPTKADVEPRYTAMNRVPEPLDAGRGDLGGDPLPRLARRPHGDRDHLRRLHGRGTPVPVSGPLFEGQVALVVLFLSFVRVIDPERHRDHNQWHQLDHLPENRALPGWRWRERRGGSSTTARWRRSRRAAGTGSTPRGRGRPFVASEPRIPAGWAPTGSARKRCWPPPPTSSPSAATSPARCATLRRRGDPLGQPLSPLRLEGVDARRDPAPLHRAHPLFI